MKPDTLNLQHLIDDDHQGVFDLLKASGLSGLPESFAHVRETLAKSWMIGTKDEQGNVTSVHLIGEISDGVAYLQSTAGKQEPSVAELRLAIRMAFNENHAVATLWTQMPRTRLTNYLNAGYIPAGPLNINMPILAMTRFLWGKISK